MKSSSSRTPDNSGPPHCDLLQGLASALLHVVGPAIPGERLLNVGWGLETGVATAGMGYQTVAVTATASIASRAQQCDPAMHVVRGELHRLPFRNGAFDVTVADLVANDVDDLTATLLECHRVTTPGGILTFAIPITAILPDGTLRRTTHSRESNRHRHPRQATSPPATNPQARRVAQMVRDVGFGFAYLGDIYLAEISHCIGTSAGAEASFAVGSARKATRGKPSSTFDPRPNELGPTEHSSTVLLAAALCR